MAVQRSRPVRMGVRKAKPDENWVAAYDADGTLIGIVDKKNITPVANASANKPAATPKATAQAAPAVPAQTPDQEAMAKAERIAELRKGLSAPRLAADNDRQAAAMAVAAEQLLAAIHGRQPRRGA